MSNSESEKSNCPCICNCIWASICGYGCMFGCCPIYSSVAIINCLYPCCCHYHVENSQFDCILNWFEIPCRQGNGCGAIVAKCLNQPNYDDCVTIVQTEEALQLMKINCQWLWCCPCMLYQHDQHCQTHRPKCCVICDMCRGIPNLFKPTPETKSAPQPQTMM